MGAGLLQEGSLKGIKVLVTRPLHQAQALCALIEQNGGTAERFPTLEILPPQNIDPVLEVISRLGDFDTAIFTSTNAVSETCHFIKCDHLPAYLKIAAVGRQTAKALEASGLHVDILPTTDFNSEGLLQTAHLQNVRGNRIVIFCGEGGREILTDKLTGRGAEVTRAEVYRRGQPENDAVPLIKQFNNDSIDIITVTSQQALTNLVAMVGDDGKKALMDIQLAVVSERIGRHATQLGFTRPPVVSETPGDEALVTAIRHWHAVHSPA